MNLLTILLIIITTSSLFHDCSMKNGIIQNWTQLLVEPTFAIRSRAKITLSTNCTFYIREHSISKNITDYPTKSTYVMYLTILMSTMSLSQKPKKTDSTPDPPENGENFISTDSPPPYPTNYERIIVHAAEVKFINNRYTTPITVEFSSSESENSVNLPVKHRIFSSPSNSSTLTPRSPSKTKSWKTLKNFRWELNT